MSQLLVFPDFVLPDAAQEIINLWMQIYSLFLKANLGMILVAGPQTDAPQRDVLIVFLSGLDFAISLIYLFCFVFK